jgi:hypothetical protein
MLGDRLAIGHDPGQHAAYVQSWIKVLEDDPLELFRAARDAERITEYVLGLEQRQEVGETRASNPHASNPHASIPHASIPQQTVPLPDRSSMEGESMRIATEKTYLAVAYADKDEARALGARWDREARSWYAPPGTALAPLARWLPEPGESRASIPQQAVAPDPHEAFGRALREAGLLVEGLPEMDGRVHRVPVEGGRPGRRDGAYVGYLDGRPAGFVQNHKTGVKLNWKAPEVAKPVLSFAEGGASA